MALLANRTSHTRKLPPVQLQWTALSPGRYRIQMIDEQYTAL